MLFNWRNVISISEYVNYPLIGEIKWELLLLCFVCLFPYPSVLKNLQTWLQKRCKVILGCPICHGCPFLGSVSFLWTTMSVFRLSTKKIVRIFLNITIFPPSPPHSFQLITYIRTLIVLVKVLSNVWISLVQSYLKIRMWLSIYSG